MYSENIVIQLWLLISNYIFNKLVLISSNNAIFFLKTNEYGGNP
jgi:hypothetical protein